MTNLPTETATLAAGCFWCSEAVFERLKGVISVTSGYSGGDMPHPTYEQVSTGTSGHAEAIQIMFDPSIISYDKILEVFWKTHDPTTPNQQGNDVGTQYRSVIFYHSPDQQKIAEASRDAAQAEFDQDIVTEIVSFENFTVAETYHQDFYNSNQSHPYCQLVIDPKIAKLNKDFKEDIT